MKREQLTNVTTDYIDQRCAILAAQAEMLAAWGTRDYAKLEIVSLANKIIALRAIEAYRQLGEDV